MAKELKAIDISNTPELLRLVEELRKGDEPRVLRRDSEDLAILTPVNKSPKRTAKRAKTNADHEGSFPLLEAGRASWTPTTLLRISTKAAGAPLVPPLNFELPHRQ